MPLDVSFLEPPRRSLPPYPRHVRMARVGSAPPGRPRTGGKSRRNDPFRTDLPLVPRYGVVAHPRAAVQCEFEGELRTQLQEQITASEALELRLVNHLRELDKELRALEAMRLLIENARAAGSGGLAAVTARCLEVRAAWRATKRGSAAFAALAAAATASKVFLTKEDGAGDDGGAADGASAGAKGKEAGEETTDVVTAMFHEEHAQQLEVLARARARHEAQRKTAEVLGIFRDNVDAAYR